MSPFYIDDCTPGNNYYELTVYISLFLLIGLIFEYNYSKDIVAIIEPLSGHSRLGNMQYVKLGLGFIGKLDIYSKYCFILMVHKCNSEYI